MSWFLKIILKKEISVKTVKAQYEIKSITGRSVFLDVYAVDSNGNHMDIEIQRASRGAIPKRARFYSSMLDSFIAPRGETFDQLSETWILFITEDDVFGLGQPLYNFERLDLETKLPLNDGSHIVYVNGSIQDDSELGLLMKDFSCTQSNEMNYNVLKERVKFFKETEEGKVLTMDKWSDYDIERFKKVEKKVEKKTLSKLIGKLISSGETIDSLAMKLDMSEDEVRKYVPKTISK